MALVVAVAELLAADWPLPCAPPPSPPDPGPLLPVPPPEGVATPVPAARRADKLETVGDAAAGVTAATLVVGVALAADWAAEVSGIGVDGLAPPAVVSVPGPPREVPVEPPLPDADWSAGWPAPVPVPGAGLVAGAGEPGTATTSPGPAEMAC